MQFNILSYLEILAGSKFRGVRVCHYLACVNKAFRGFNFRVLQPPTKNAKLKTPRNFLPVRYLFVSSIECELNQFKLSSRHPFIVAGMGSLQLQRLVRVSVLYQTL